MARIRNIKPEFFTSEKIGSLTVLSRLLFVALWCQADRNGNMKFSRVALAAQCMPYEFDQFDGCLAELAAEGLVIHYEVEAKKYLHIPGFAEHQRPHHTEPKSNIPEPLRDGTEIIRVETEIVVCGADNLGQEREREREREEEENQSSIGGGSAEPPREENPVGKENQIEAEVKRIESLHRRVCGLDTLPPVAIVREILHSGLSPGQIDDVYQACGGDIRMYRQRNIVERLTALRDGREVPARASPQRQARKRSAAELRQEATFAAARAWAEGQGGEA